jgi:putative heme-binding domain-containing protein
VGFGQSGASQTWRVPSRAECLACHSRAAEFVLGVSELQMNRDHDYPAGRGNQLQALAQAGYFVAPLPKPPAECSKLPDAYDTSHTIEQRARAYLHVNCSMCHVAAGGGNAQMELPFTVERDAMKLLGARPQHDTFGIENAMLVAPGEPGRSVLMRRISQRGRGQMPPLGSRRVDDAAVTLFLAWIAELPPARPIVQRWTLADLASAVDEPGTSRSLETGKKVFRETGCIQCHRFDGEGGSVGPDLTAIGKRSNREILESILEPAKVIAEAYATYLVQTSDGETLSGRIEHEDEQRLLLRLTGSFEAPREIPLQDIEARRRLETSNMPAGTVDVLTKDEVLDLMAYLRHPATASLRAVDKPD